LQAKQPITGTILVADDQSSNRELLEELLTTQKQVGFALGAADYLIKPIRKPVLLETIRKQVPAPSDDDDATICWSMTTVKRWSC
jgi:CheY-like chemotaxis protein